MYFSEKWVDKLHNDKAWHRLKLYVHELAWNYYEYERNRVFYDITFSMIQKKRNLKPNPYLTDTARHLFATALGAVPGYIPACNEDALPLGLLQKVFVESYGLKKYIPTIMQPIHFNFENDKLPIYYSLKNPSTHIFSPKSRSVFSTLVEMRELQHIVKVFAEELAKDSEVCSDTVMGKAAKNVEFKYFHNELDRLKTIKSSADITHLDERFNYVSPICKTNSTNFAADSSFVRGCISIQTKS